jgi:hypothetical protein
VFNPHVGECLVLADMAAPFPEIPEIGMSPPPCPGACSSPLHSRAEPTAIPDITHHCDQRDNAPRKCGLPGLLPERARRPPPSCNSFLQKGLVAASLVGQVLDERRTLASAEPLNSVLNHDMAAS